MQSNFNFELENNGISVLLIPFFCHRARASEPEIIIPYRQPKVKRKLQKNYINL